mmetsp:Transcript_69834/g.196927  ORF Transcript_69834/g.196927 Transcript_69834/m.196927 type:complete len:208 (+) Transcript_69834:1379-2002(+)
MLTSPDERDSTACTNCGSGACPELPVEATDRAKIASIERLPPDCRAWPSRNQAFGNMAPPPDARQSLTARSPSSTAPTTSSIFRRAADRLQYKTRSSKGACTIATVYAASASAKRFSANKAFAFWRWAAARCAAGAQRLVRSASTTQTLSPKPTSLELGSRLHLRTQGRQTVCPSSNATGSRSALPQCAQPKSLRDAVGAFSCRSCL